MIKNISSSGKYINVIGESVANYINNYSGAQGVGNIRFNTVNQSMEVYDGNGWITLQMGHVNVGLNSRAEDLLDWAEKKMTEELELEVLANSNPTIKDLMETIKQKQEQISIVRTLIKKEESVETR
jgi:hypothetical protein